MYQINFNNFNFPEDQDYEVYTLRGERNNKVLTDKIKICHINLEKISKKGYNISELSGIEKVSRFLLSEDIEEMKELVGEGMNDIIEKIIDLSNDDRIIGLYNREELEEEIKEAQIESAMEEGIKKGIVQSKIEIAKKMLEKNSDIEFISEVTGLTIDEIETLKK